MTIAELLDAAKRAQGSLTNVAEKLEVDPAKLSEWRKGKYKPDATNIAQLAELANLPVFKTLAEIECDLETERASVWERALGNLRTAGIAATVVLGVTAVVAAEMPKAEASEHGLVRPAGIEPATPAFGGQYSIH